MRSRYGTPTADLHLQQVEVPLQPKVTLISGF
jgi:hypothetical protein